MRSATGQLPRLLIVDDSRDAAHSLAVVLQSAGYVAEAAVGGLEALEKAALLRPHIVLMDLAMPMMDGIETAIELRKISGLEDITFVALTGWNRDEDFARTRELGFYAHLVKPTPFEELVATLEACPLPDYP